MSAGFVVHILGIACYPIPGLQILVGAGIHHDSGVFMADHNALIAVAFVPISSVRTADTDVSYLQHG